MLGLFTLSQLQPGIWQTVTVDNGPVIRLTSPIEPLRRSTARPDIPSKTLRGRLVELRPADLVGPYSARWLASWWVWRLEDMHWLGSASVHAVDGSVFSVGAWISSRFGRYEGGYGAEIYRLLARFAVDELGAAEVRASTIDLPRRAALEGAGFRLSGSWPRQHAKRRRGHGLWRFVWRP